MRILPAILLLICSACSSPAPAALPPGAEPKANITVIQEPFAFVVSSAGSIHDTDVPSWRVSGITAPIKSESLVFPNPTPGQYKFDLTVGGIVGSKVHLASQTSVLTVPGPVPPSPNPPTPVPPTPVPPGPTPPPLPNGQFGFAKLTYDAAQLVPQPARGKAAVLANAFDSTSAAIGAGAISTWDAAMVVTRDANILALGTDKPAWEDVRKAINDHTATLYGEKKLVSVTDIATAWREIATGLRAVK